MENQLTLAQFQEYKARLLAILTQLEGIDDQDEAHIAQFLREVKAKNVFANISPTVERKIDFNQSDLVREKTIGLPINYKIDFEQDNK
ncbi:MAG TPA: hypothetical protein PK737_00350 [Bacilli bacterium]|mgnify:CR=1 FL=1|nr:hypothetical protein [Bacilli bacterium]